ncbi:MAG: diaminopimelate epimerase [Clostridium sp.]
MIPVTKYHGCGNDFIITDWERVMNCDIEDFVVKVCDRHTGIGADGCILVKQHPLEMVFYNGDGSRAPMCGNGIRCFAKYCYDERIETAGEYDVETLAGRKHVTRVSLDPFQVRIDMGTWDDDPKSIQVDALKEPVMGYELPLGDKARTIQLLYVHRAYCCVCIRCLCL